MTELVVGFVLLIPALIGFAIGVVAGKEQVIDDALIDGRSKVYGKWWRVTVTKEGES